MLARKTVLEEFTMSALVLLTQSCIQIIVASVRTLGQNSSMYHSMPLILEAPSKWSRYSTLPLNGDSL